MSRRRTIGAITLGLFLATASIASTTTPAFAEEAADAPHALIANRYADIEKIIRSTSDEEQMREQLRVLMGDFIDYDLFSKLAAKKFWDEMKPAQRKEFVRLFTKLVQHTYLKRFKANQPFKVKIAGEAEYNSKKTKARVLSIITSGKVSADVVYKLYQPKGREGWWAYDVAIDEVSLMRNYRVSFNKTWEKGGYKLLISKMRKKLDKVDKTGDGAKDGDDQDDIGSLD